VSAAGYYSDSWDDADKRASSGGKWLRLGDGDSVQVILTSNPLSRAEHGFGKASQLCPLERCSICASGEAPKGKVSFVAFDLEAGTLRVLDLSGAAYKPIKQLGRDAAKANVLRLSRVGSGFATQYAARVVRPITDADRAAIEACQQIDLHAVVLGDTKVAAQLAPAGSPNGGHGFGDTSDDQIPF
jgi:hypothetical protein